MLEPVNDESLCGVLLQGYTKVEVDRDGRPITHRILGAPPPKVRYIRYVQHECLHPVVDGWNCARHKDWRFKNHCVGDRGHGLRCVAEVRYPLQRCPRCEKKWVADNYPEAVGLDDMLGMRYLDVLGTRMAADAMTDA